MRLRGRSGIFSRRPLTAAVLAVSAVAGAISIGTSAADDKWWRDYAGGPESSRYFPSKQITAKNVGSLEVAWTYPWGETGFNPIVVGGVVYGRGRNGAIVALDAKTGKEIWIHEGMQAMTARGMNYWESKDGKDRRLIFAMYDYLQEIDANTGLSIRSFGNNGVVDLREGVGRDPKTIGRIQSGTPGRVFENLIIVGGATGEAYMSPPGYIRAYDVVTGKHVWTFHTVPLPGEFGYDTWPKDAYKYIGGTNVWGEISVDVERGIVYLPTASPTYDYYGADRPGANLFSDCLLALDARTGKRLWHFQTTHHDIWDFDNSAAPQLTRIRQNGKYRDVVAMAGKTGFLYVFDRVTGEPIWPIEERPVPKSTMPGEQSWPTQPFPTRPEAFSKHTFTEDDINPTPMLTDAEREAFRGRLRKTKNLGLFTPIDLTDTLHIPGSNGGALFGYTASEPTTGNLYLISQDNPAILHLLPPKPGAGGPPGMGVYVQNCQACHGADRSGTENGPTLQTLAGRVSPTDVRAAITNGKGRMPAFPHLSATDVDALVTFLTSPGFGRGGRGGRGGAAGTFPPGPVVGSGGAQTRPPGGPGRLGGPREYPEGIEKFTQYVINEYGTIGIRMKPPFTVLQKYDLNTGERVWRVGLGDDARAVAHGITGTGVTQMRSSLIVTEGGLIFAPGGDSKVRAYSTTDGSLLWTTSVGGAIRGAPSMYEMDGRQYLLVHASGEIAEAGRLPGTNPPADLPKGYVAYALPAK